MSAICPYSSVLLLREDLGLDECVSYVCLVDTHCSSCVQTAIDMVAVHLPSPAVSALATGAVVCIESFANRTDDAACSIGSCFLQHCPLLSGFQLRSLEGDEVCCSSHCFISSEAACSASTPPPTAASTAADVELFNKYSSLLQSRSAEEDAQRHRRLESKTRPEGSSPQGEQLYSE